VGVKRLVIAIDGPAASGKSTTARLVAQHLGYLHVDTGAMYRAVALKLLRKGVPPSDTAEAERVAKESTIDLRQQHDGLHVFLDGEDVTGEIREAAVTRTVSGVSAIRGVREALVRKQRAFGRDGGVVVEGRDIGTIVFPDADLKIFMVADLNERSRRRARELSGRGVEAEADRVGAEIARRDRLDSTREESPLTKAADAIELDTSGLTIEDQVGFVMQKAMALLASE
jgi:cytidylate kinase